MTVITRRVRLPPKRVRPKFGIPHGIKREWPRHRAFLRRHRCVVGRIDCSDQIEVAHVRSAANSGTGLKPGDFHAVPLCVECHRLQHQIGQPEFEKQFGIDLLALAAEFARQSPDRAMREAIGNEFK